MRRFMNRYGLFPTYSQCQHMRRYGSFLDPHGREIPLKGQRHSRPVKVHGTRLPEHVGMDPFRDVRFFHSR